MVKGRFPKQIAGTPSPYPFKRKEVPAKASIVYTRSFDTRPTAGHDVN